MPGNKRPWRKELKKQQRKRRRRKTAIARDLHLEEEEERKLKDPAYQHFLQQQEQLEKDQLRTAEQRHAEEEEAWLKRDLLAQREFRLKQQERAATEAIEEAKRKQQAEELAAKEAEQRRRREERERKVAAAAAEFEQMMQCMETFLNNDGPPPIELRRIVESRPGQTLCILYERTNCCRFGVTCNNNHRRPLLSNTIVVRHFFMHPLLEQYEHKEYVEADGDLELSERDLREAYDEFFDDVVPELEVFGYMLNFRAVRNVARHLRGQVFIEYMEERSALKAFIKLQNRYYAGRQLNVEFSSIKNWRSAICGLSHARKCPKGVKCQYLHLFKNPGNKYNTPLVVNRTPSIRGQSTTPLISWNMVTAKDVKETSRNWRWSESPEIEIISKRKIDLTNNAKTENEHDECNKKRTATQFGQPTCSQTKKSIENADVDSESKRKRRKLKSKRDKAKKTHKKKLSRSSERADERHNCEQEDYIGEKKHKRKRSRSLHSPPPAQTNNGNGKHKDDNRENKRSTTKDKSQRKYRTDNSDNVSFSVKHEDKSAYKDDSSNSKYTAKPF